MIAGVAAAMAASSGDVRISPDPSGDDAPGGEALRVRDASAHNLLATQLVTRQLEQEGRFVMFRWDGLSSDFSVQNSRCLGVRGKGMTSRIFVTPVTVIKKRSNPRPNPACGTVPKRRMSRYHQ